MSNELSATRLLTRHTDFKMICFKPVIRLYDTDSCVKLYKNKLLAQALVNVYPTMEGDSNSIYNDCCFLVFESRKLGHCIDAYKEFVLIDNLLGEIPVENKDYTVLIYQFPPAARGVIEKYIEGNYRNMFTYKQLNLIKNIFIRPSEYGLEHKDNSGVEWYDTSFHILKFTKEYEKHRADDLGIPYEEFKGQTAQHKSPPDIKGETLSISLLSKQHKV